jgi:hypothetical protein
MADAVESRKFFPGRIRIRLKDDPGGSVRLPLPVQRSVPLAAMFGVMFAIFASIDFLCIRRLFEPRADTVFGLASAFFDGFWALVWTMAVLFLLGVTLLTLFYREAARIAGDLLIHVARLGPLHVLSEYELARIRNVRVENEKKLGRIRFDYDGGTVSLGSAMERGVAEQHVKAVAAAIGTPAPTAAPPAIEAERPANLVSQPAAGNPHLSAIFLVAANLVPVVGVLLFDWSVADLMVLFWAENVVIGVYALLKMAVISRWGVLMMGPLFLGHYGLFMAIHLLFVYYMFVRGITAVGPEPAASTAIMGLFVPLWPALLALVVSHGVSFFYNFLGRREYVGRTMQQQTAEPYQRMALLHVTIVIGAWPVLLLGQPLLALLLLVVLKIVMDLRAHLKERSAAARRRTP